MSERILIDTSGFFAFLNEADLHHVEAKGKLLKGRGLTTNFVFDELMTLLAARGQKDLAITFGEELRRGSAISYYHLTQIEEGKAWQLFKKFRDQPLSFTDCTTLIVAKEHRISSLLSFDQTLVRLFPLA